MGVRQRSRTARAIWTPSFARRVAHNRVVRIAAAVTLVSLGAAALRSQAAAIDAERRSWGTTVEVVVVTQPIQTGALISGSVEVRPLPRAVVPLSAVYEVGTDARAKAELHVGEIVLSPRVTGTDERLGAGVAALTLSIAARVPLADDGDLVDLYAIDSANFSSRRVGQRLVVLALTDDEVTVAVPTGQVADLTAASLRPVTMVVVG